MVLRIYLLILLFSISKAVSAQNENNFIVKNIYFEGVKKTKPSFLKDHINTKEGKATNQKQIEADLQLIKNLASIAHATYHVDTLEKEITLSFKIEERKTLLPILNFGGIKDNLWFRVGLSDSNWRGKDQTLLAFYQNNSGRHAAQLYLRNPRIKNTNWGYAFNLNKWASTEPLYFDKGTVLYDYDFNSISLSGIRHFGKHRFFEFGGNFFIEKYAQAQQQSLENPPGPQSFTQTKLLSKFTYQENFINYFYFYQTGWDWHAIQQNVYNTKDKTWFQSFQIQARAFARPTDKINLAARLRFGISTNNDSPFAPFVADSHVNLRGIGNRIDRGTAQVILNLEYRQTLFHVNRWGSQVVAFSDIGSWRNPGGNLSDLLDKNQFRQFLGIGFRLNYQKVFGATLRVDYSIDIFNTNQRGFVIGLGQYF